MYPEPIRKAPKLHQDSRGTPVTPGDWLVDSLNPSLQPLQVVRLHGAGQFVYLSETGTELTSFCCCFKICPPPASQGLGDSLAAPAAVGQGVCTNVVLDSIFLCIIACVESSNSSLQQVGLNALFALEGERLGVFATARVQAGAATAGAPALPDGNHGDNRRSIQ